LVAEAERVAKREGRTQSELFREALRVVADTHVYVFALHFGGVVGEVLTLGRATCESFRASPS
jgi:hypothetical protein